MVGGLHETVQQHAGITKAVEDLVHAVIGPSPGMAVNFSNFVLLPPGQESEPLSWIKLHGDKKPERYYLAFPVPVVQTHADSTGIDWDALGLDEEKLGKSEQRIHSQYNKHHKYYLVFTGESKTQWDWEQECLPTCGKKGKKQNFCRGANVDVRGRQPAAEVKDSPFPAKITGNPKPTMIMVGRPLCLCDTFFATPDAVKDWLFNARWMETEGPQMPLTAFCGPLNPSCRTQSQDRLGMMLFHSGILHTAVHKAESEGAFVAKHKWMAPIWQKVVETSQARRDMLIDSKTRDSISFYRHVKVLNDVCKFRSTCK